MMDVTEVKTKVACAKEKMLGGEVTMTKCNLTLIATICVLTGVVLGLCKGLKICTKKLAKECKCNTEDCSQQV